MTSNQEPDSYQSIGEMVVRLIATYIFGVALYGHLGSLTKIPSRTHALYVLTYIFFPAIIAAQVFLNFIGALNYTGEIMQGHDGENPELGGFDFYSHAVIGAPELLSFRASHLIGRTGLGRTPPVSRYYRRAIRISNERRSWSHGLGLAEY